MSMFIDPGAIRQLINVNMNKTHKRPGSKKQIGTGISIQNNTDKAMTIFESPNLSPTTRRKSQNQSFDATPLTTSTNMLLLSTASGSL